MTISIRQLLPPFILALTLFAPPAWATLEIRITQGIEGAQPIAVVPFGWQGAAPQPPEDVAAVIGADLHRSGHFVPLAAAEMPQRPVEPDDIRFAEWRAKGVEYVVIGQVVAQGEGRFGIQFRLFDSVRGEQMMGHSISASAAELRMAAHKIADLVFERLTGVRGAFSTHIAYISTERAPGSSETRFLLHVADSDGHNPRLILRSVQPIMSPSWAPDGNRLAYVSFERRRPEIYIHHLGSGEREKVASFDGINGAPAWSPDGRRLALTLSKDGAPDIYLLDVGSGALTQVTRGMSIDTEPVWMPDGQTIAFTSDRAGSPQIYRVGIDGGRPRRLTFDGRYNAGATVAPDGRKMALVSGESGRYRIAVLDMVTGNYRVITNGRLDESPSFAPNGSMIIYATEERGRGVLAAVSEDGRVRQSLVLADGEVREPAWSPFID